MRNCKIIPIYSGTRNFYKYDIIPVSGGKAPIEKNATDITGMTPIIKNSHKKSVQEGMIPIIKNITVVDENEIEYEPTYLRRAQGLVKHGRARFVAENKISPSDLLPEEIPVLSTKRQLKRCNVGSSKVSFCRWGLAGLCSMSKEGVFRPE